MFKKNSKLTYLLKNFPKLNSSIRTKDSKFWNKQKRKKENNSNVRSSFVFIYKIDIVHFQTIYLFEERKIRSLKKKKKKREDKKQSCSIHFYVKLISSNVQNVCAVHAHTALAVYNDSNSGSTNYHFHHFVASPLPRIIRSRNSPIIERGVEVEGGGGVDLISHR